MVALSGQNVRGCRSVIIDWHITKKNLAHVPETLCPSDVALAIQSLTYCLHPYSAWLELSCKFQGMSVSTVCRRIVHSAYFWGRRRWCSTRAYSRHQLVFQELSPESHVYKGSHGCTSEASEYRVLFVRMLDKEDSSCGPWSRWCGCFPGAFLWYLSL